MKKFIALLVAAAAVVATIPALSGCSSDVYVKYTLYNSEGESVAAYKVSTDPAGEAALAQAAGEEYEEPVIDAEDGCYFAVTGYNGKITDVVIPESYGGVPVTTIGSNAFENARYLTSVEIPDSVTQIGAACFFYCVRLEEVTLSSSLTELPKSMFAYCDSLAQVIIPDSVTQIGQYCFYYCEELESVNLPDNIEIIGSYAFKCCYQLSVPSIPDNIEKIGAYAFNYCISITSLEFSGNLTYIGEGAFLNCTKLTSVTFLDSPAYIGIGAFQNCQLLADIDLGSKITQIDEQAFCNCLALEEIILPADLEYIGANAFLSCTALQDIYLDSYFTNGSSKICWLYTCNLSDAETDDGKEEGYYAPGSDNASVYLSSYNYYGDGVETHQGYIPASVISDSEGLASILTELTDSTALEDRDSATLIYFYFVEA